MVDEEVESELQLLAADDVYSWETGHMTSVVTPMLLCGYRAKLLPPPLRLKVPQAVRRRGGVGVTTNCNNKIFRPNGCGEES